MQSHEIALAELFGGLEMNIVRDACSDQADTKRDAWMGDARLKLLLSELLFDQGPPSPGVLTQLRARYEANDTLAWFLLEATDMTRVYDREAHTRSSHGLGTTFEALLQRAPDDVRKGVVITYMEWVEARFDPQLVVQRVERMQAPDGDVWMKTYWEWKSSLEGQDDDGKSAAWSTRTVQSNVSTEEGVRSALKEMSLQFNAWREDHAELALSLGNADLQAALEDLESKLRVEAALRESGNFEQKNDREKSLGQIVFNIAMTKGPKGTTHLATLSLYQLAIGLKEEGIDAKFLQRVFTYVNRYYVKQNNVPKI